jgi:hypothetical protein
VFRAFEKESGIAVRAVFDTEETKSTGVLNRLVAEAGTPQADVFWSGDPVRPFLLVKRGRVWRPVRASSSRTGSSCRRARRRGPSATWPTRDGRGGAPLPTRSSAPRPCTSRPSSCAGASRSRGHSSTP